MISGYIYLRHKLKDQNSNEITTLRQLIVRYRIMLTDPSVLKRIGLLAELTSPTTDILNDHKFILRKNIGKGYIQKIDLGPSMHIMISQYELNSEMLLKRPKVAQEYGGKNIITFSFRDVKRLPSVMVSSADMDLEIFTPAHIPTSNIIITIHSDLLKDLIRPNGAHTPWDNIISGNQPFLYEEISSVEIQRISLAIINAQNTSELNSFYYRIKAEELIFLFFKMFLKRSTIAAYPLNSADIKVIYQIRDLIIADLSITPNLSALVELSAMSESKLQRLFKQIFGNTIYNYHQLLRIKEAARLIKDENMSVSEAGYKLNFSNLSYFSRLFEKHIGLKPKKYSILSRS